jgi:hypothetical protein
MSSGSVAIVCRQFPALSVLGCAGSVPDDQGRLAGKADSPLTLHDAEWFAVDLTTSAEGFRDEHQRRRVQFVIHDRLADDRDQEECRQLMKLFWQLGVSYRETTLSQLRQAVRPEKMAVVEALIAALRRSHEAVDEWIDATEVAYPIVEDRGYWRQP